MNGCWGVSQLWCLPRRKIFGITILSETDSRIADCSDALIFLVSSEFVPFRQRRFSKKCFGIDAGDAGFGCTESFRTLLRTS